MEQGVTYLILLALIVIVSRLFENTTIPNSLMLVVTGMLLGLIPHFPHVMLNPNVVLNVILPLLIYKISAFSSWQAIKNNLRPIMLLSIGHVIFITFVIAIVMYYLMPAISWPLAFVLGAVISPPDDVAIVAIAEKIRMPDKVVTILEGEAMLNDATALILFRFALAAVITHQFSAMHAIGYFVTVLVAETLYGLVLGYVIGNIRLKIDNPILHILTSFLTPFCAYLPAEMLGGSGILATAITGFVIGHFYSVKFTPDFRLFSQYIWPTLSFVMQSLLFLLVGLNMTMIVNNISSIKTSSLFLYATVITSTVIIGRFVWVYVFVEWLPCLFSKRWRKAEIKMPWQYPFIVSWAGMRGAISLAAALAVPMLPALADGTDPRYLIIFLVVIVIIVTLLFQGLSLPWLLKLIGINTYGEKERYEEHLTEIKARLHIAKSVLRWLADYKRQIDDVPELIDEVKLYRHHYRLLKSRLQRRLDHHVIDDEHDELAELQFEIALHTKIIEFERELLFKLWHAEKISFAVKNKLLEKLDHRIKHLGV